MEKEKKWTSFDGKYIGRESKEENLYLPKIEFLELVT
jgi:hypothetical protein